MLDTGVVCASPSRPQSTHGSGLVDGIFSNLHRLSLMVRLSDSFSEDDRDVMADLLARIPRAQEVALTYATSERERDEIVMPPPAARIAVAMTGYLS
jgi:hypothetical protein